MLPLGAPSSIPNAAKAFAFAWRLLFVALVALLPALAISVVDHLSARPIGTYAAATAPSPFIRRRARPVRVPPASSGVDGGGRFLRSPGLVQASRRPFAQPKSLGYGRLDVVCLGLISDRLETLEVICMLNEEA